MLLAAEDLVDREGKGVVEHAGQELLEDGRGVFDAGIGVDLDQPRVALVV